VLLLPALSDSLAGRMDILRLYPLAQCELAKHKPTLIDELFAGDFKFRRYERLGQELPRRVAAGGYPAALARTSERRRAAWYRDYIETIVQRDVRLLSRISSLDVLPRLLAFAATQTARLLNTSELATPFQLSRPTIRDYVTLLQHVFLIEELPPWHSNRLSRLIKTPKLHVGDTGVACHLLGVDADALVNDRVLFGQLLETFVYQELRRLGSWHERELRFHHLRDKEGVEVDVVIERGTRELVGVEVKASSTIKSEDFRGLNKLKAAVSARFSAGVVFYDGEASVRFGEKLFALPIRKLWED
jgi:predicted AAA+ superfamily ATPase